MIAIILASALDFYSGMNTLKLIIPSKFAPTAPRTWIVPFYSGQNGILSIFIAIVPAIIATILIFMDQQITAVIVNRKEFKLKVIQLFCCCFIYYTLYIYSIFFNVLCLEYIYYIIIYRNQVGII